MIIEQHYSFHSKFKEIAHASLAINHVQQTCELQLVNDLIADKVQEIISNAHQEKKEVLTLFSKILDFNPKTNLTAEMLYGLVST